MADTRFPTIILPFKQYWQAGIYDGSAYSVSLSNSATIVDTAVSGANQLFSQADYVDASAGATYMHFLLPSDWYSAAGIDIRIVWKTPAVTGSVVWQIKTAFSASGATADPAFNAAQTIIDAAPGTTNFMKVCGLTALTLTGAAASKVMFLEVLRDPTHGSDNLNNTASLIGIELTYRRALVIG